MNLIDAKRQIDHLLKGLLDNAMSKIAPEQAYHDILIAQPHYEPDRLTAMGECARPPPMSSEDDPDLYEQDNQGDMPVHKVEP